MTTFTRFVASAIPASLLALGCGPDTGVIDPATPSDGVEASRASKRYSAWSAPVNLGPVVNSPLIDNSPELSEDRLSLYFGSTRPVGFGSTDLYVSQRACTNINLPLCAWGIPVNLGSAINTASIDGGPTLDGRLLYLISDRPGGIGSNDIYVSRRKDKHDDFAWETPVNLGPPVNTVQLEAGPNPWGREFYFHRGPAVGNTDIYVSRIRGTAFDEPILVAELSSPGFFTQRPSISSDGREMFFSSNRPGSLNGTQDIWTSTRHNKRAKWTTPVNLGITINGVLQEQTPMISDDGTMLFFSSNSTGNFDLYVATRTVQGQGEEDQDQDDEDED